MRSIRWKLIIMTVALLFIVMISTGTFIIYSLRANEESSARLSLENTCRYILETGMKNLDDPDAISAWLAEIRLAEADEAAVIDPDGITVAATVVNADAAFRFPVYDSAAVVSALAGEPLFIASARKSPDASGREHAWMEYAEPVTDETGLRYAVYARKIADSSYAYVDQMTRTISIALVVSLCGTLVIGAYIASSITGPILRLTQKAKSLADGNLAEEIPIAARDEIGQLTDSFNNMSRDLAAKMLENIREKNKLEIVLYNMTDGVLAYEGSGAVLHYNSASQELLGMDDIETLSMGQMLERLGIDTGGHSEAWRDTSLYVNGKYLNAACAPFKNPEGGADGMIMVFQDVTKHIKLDNMRKEFVANASHEIRTPITTIKSYTETLLDGAVEDRETALSFLNTINAEVDRMTRIVADLLDLSKLDAGKMDLKFEKLDLAALIRDNVKNHAVTAARTDKTVNFAERAYEAYVLADAERVNQVLNNIISNSMKYSGEGAEINVRLEESPEFFRVYVRDNGIGIPKEDLRHIFERFYRVDKARSRAMGGTGLGLSIARQIMEAHGGKISASSVVDKGTTMILRFPKYEEDVQCV